MRSIRIALICLFICGSLVQGVAAAPPIRSFYGVVTKVSDGDTLHINADGTKLRVRLAYMDAPEIPHGNIPGQPFGEESGQALAAMCLGKKVRLDVVDIDRYRRMVGIVYLGDMNINLAMVRAGWAMVYREYLAPEWRSQFLTAEALARQKHSGIWCQGIPQKPSDYRRHYRN